MSNQLKIKIAFTLISLASLTTFGQTKKLVNSFKLGTISYNLYTLSSKSSNSKIDTTYYLLYRAGNTKVLAKEIGELKNKENGETMFYYSYQIFPKYISFKRADDEQNHNFSRYTQNSKGLLVFDTFTFPIPKEDYPTMAEAYPTTGQREPEIAETMPEYPGGINAARAYIASKFTYPTIAIENKVEGKVDLKFTVETDGSVGNITFLRKLGYGYEEEITRVLKNMPRWTPATSNGKNVPNQIRMPLIFQVD